MKVLVVDDHQAHLETVGNMLTAAGHDVTLASSGREALDILADSLVFDAVVTDMALPDGDGVDIIRELRQQSDDIWIVAMSGGSERASSDRLLTLAQAFGVDEIIFKPFGRADLLAAITRR